MAYKNFVIFYLTFNYDAEHNNNKAKKKEEEKKKEKSFHYLKQLKGLYYFVSVLRREIKKNKLT